MKKVVKFGGSSSQVPSSLRKWEILFMRMREEDM